MSGSLQASSTGPTSPGHCLHLPLPAPSPSITDPPPIHHRTVQEQARSVNPRRLGLSVLYRAERCYMDPYKTPGPCEAIPKTLTKTGFWPRCQPSLPGLMMLTELRQGFFADPPIQRSDRNCRLVYSSSRRYFAIHTKNPHPTSPSPSLSSMGHLTIGRLVLSLHCKGNEAGSLLPLSSESNIRHVL